MPDSVHWVLELAIEPENTEAFKVVMADLVAATEKEAGTVAYEWHFNEAGTICHIYERFRDSAAAAIHLGMFGESFAERFLEAGRPTRLTVFGDPAPEVIEILSGFSPLILKREAGFSRFL